MTGNFYSLGILRAKPGAEAELLARWQAFCDQLSRLPGPPAGPVTLIQDVADPSLHYSFAPWRSLEDVQGMRADTATVEFLRAIAEVCSEVSPGIFRVVGRAPNS